MNRRLRLTLIVAIALIVTHLVISTIHGAAHQGAMVNLNTFGYIYVLVVITIAPVVAGVLLLTRKRSSGALLLAVSMLGSFVFGFWYHFLSATNDHISQVRGEWQPTFLWTAIALAVIELAGTATGFILYRRTRTP